MAILSSAFHLRERLAQILFLYHENAADLFPRKITHISRDAVVDPKRGRRGKQQKTPKNKTPPHVARPIVTENLDPERFPEQLEALAKDVITFLNCLNEFPEFMDEAVNASIVAFEGDLKVCMFLIFYLGSLLNLYFYSIGRRVFRNTQVISPCICHLMQPNSGSG